MGIRRAIYLSLLLIVVLNGRILAEDEAVPDFATEVKFDFAQWCQVGEHKFVLESSTLADVVKILGGGRIVNTGTPGNADPLWVIEYRNGKDVVRFEADGDMGGDEHRLTGVSTFSARDYPGAAKLPRLNQRVSFPFGELGMKFSDLETILGASNPRKNLVWYKYEGQTKIPNRMDIRGTAQIFDVSVYLSARVGGGKVIEIGFSHITTS